MGKRSDFKRVEKDYYPTPEKAVLPLLPFLYDLSTFYEPCAGDGRLISHLEKYGYLCNGASDIDPQPSKHLIATKNALEITEDDCNECDYIITNPPWSRNLLHPMIDHFRTLKPTWLLFDADWAHTKQSIPYLRYCHLIVPIGRVKWIPDSKYTGKDNVCWYMFDSTERLGGTRFCSR